MDRASTDELPDWLTHPQDYEPGRDRDGFVAKNLLALSSVLALFRLDDGRSSRLSPSAPVKLVIGLVCILLTSLSHNFAFVLAMLALVLVRACLLPPKALARVAAGAGGAAGITMLVMLPAIALGQPHAALLLGTKSLASSGIALIVALTTPQGALTGALRSFGVPSMVILTVDLALRSIVSLGRTAEEALCALRLRSVGTNRDKRASMGGVAGIVLVKAGRASQDTHDAMRCRGFTGTYEVRTRYRPKPADLCWMAGTAALAALFAYLQAAAG